MGEVFLAYDPVCKRNVALKKIREDLLKYPSIKTRFLQEALIAAGLSHPAIIPIFAIHDRLPDLAYTMPYVEGKTLKELLEKETIPALMQIFLTVCQGVAYAHAMGVLHRDLKPENILVGKYGEVVILDWGLAEQVGTRLKEMSGDEEEIPEVPGLTRPGKTVGTLAFLAPERARGDAASPQTDIYALGVILYQILTLELPFRRKDLATFQRMLPYEMLANPVEIAPHRDIPPSLAKIAERCLAKELSQRYLHVEQMIVDLKAYLDGKPEWQLTAEFDIEQKEPWELQEHVVLAKHVAITRAAEILEWVTLMIGKKPFPGNLRIELDLTLRPGSHGLGVLFNIPPASQREQLPTGDYLWISTEGLELFRSNVEVMEQPGPLLEPGSKILLALEKGETDILVFLNGELRLKYLSQVPFSGAQIGLLFRDTEFTLHRFSVFTGSQSTLVSCLAVGDAFLEADEFDHALTEYRQVAASFPGRPEGWEAIFRSGITLLEQGKRHWGEALEEFGKLGKTAAAPLEYLGKSLVYKQMNDLEEEAKCLELALRKYGSHPLAGRIVDEIVFRLHESAYQRRKAAYLFALIVLRHLPHLFQSSPHQELLSHLKVHSEVPPFLEGAETEIVFAFFLADARSLLEIASDPKASVEMPLLALLFLGKTEAVASHPRLAEAPNVQAALEKSVEPRLPLGIRLYVLTQKLKGKITPELLSLIRDPFPLLYISAILSLHRWDEAKELLDTFSIEEKSDDRSPLYPLFGCYLWAVEGEEIGQAHFAGALETPYPKTPALLGLFLLDKLAPGWEDEALFFEKEALFQYLVLFYTCIDDAAKAKRFRTKLKRL
jgi:serine/threonine-protein kinase